MSPIVSTIACIEKEALQAIQESKSLLTLEDVRQQYFGKAGVITTLLKGMGTATPEERQTQGPLLNGLRTTVMTALESKRDSFEQETLNIKLQTERIDVTLPGRDESEGYLHPIPQVMEEVMAIFGAMGFAVKEGPHIEDDFHNFTALNVPPEHPAREAQDTFYLNAERDGMPLLLRTQTSPVQIRTLMTEKPPIRVISPGRVFRADYDITHTPVFHQVEGLLIDKEITMGHLKGCLVEFLETFFGIKDLPIRFRPSFFPFTEPSAEVDIGCTRKDGTLKIGAGDSWLEILGCGMVHPKVLRNCTIDPKEYQGFAFGMGIERIAMLKYGIPDLRTFFESDVRWMDHYGFKFFERPSILNKVGGC